MAAGHPLSTANSRGHARPNAQPQMLFFKAATQYALTIVLAGLALTTTTLPNISRLPAFVAGFVRVFTMQSPGMVTFPALLTCLVATAARLSSTFTQSFFFSSVSVAMASAKPPLDKALAAPFIAYALGAMVATRQTAQAKQRDAKDV